MMKVPRCDPSRLGCGILSAIGNTPTLRLQRLLPSNLATVVAKLEFLNPGGSMKDRPALEMLRTALADGRISRNGLVIESSSGNMGIGLAQAAAYLGLRFICVIDIKTTITTRQILQSYGADVVVVEHPHPTTGLFLDARLDRVSELLKIHPEAFWPNQYANLANPTAHRLKTAVEFTQDIGGAVDIMLISTSTCGTLAGFAQHFEDIGASTRLIAVDAKGSALFDVPAQGRLIPGLGSAQKPQVPLPDDLKVIHVSNQDCVAGCRVLVRREAILAGGSTGALVSAAIRLAPTLAPDTVLGMLFPDRGERYTKTIYDDEWVACHIGDPDRLTEELENELSLLWTSSDIGQDYRSVGSPGVLM